jgi:hypothetical protein
MSDREVDEAVKRLARALKPAVGAGIPRYPAALGKDIRTVLSALATRTKALEAFSLADNLDRNLADDIRLTIMRGMITANDFRFARKALTGGQDV